MPDPTGPRSRWRLDGVALAALAVGIAVAVLLAFDSPFGDRSRLGPFWEIVPRALHDSLGLAAAVLVSGWFAIAILYIAKRSWLRLAVRSVGWLSLAFCGATFADFLAVANVSAFGSGGSLGAWCRFQLTDRLPYPLPAIVLAAATFLGLMLAMDNLIRATFFFTVRTIRGIFLGLKRGNDLVAAGGDKVIAGFGAVGKKLSEAKQQKANTSPEPIPIIRHTEAVVPAPIPEVETPAPIPVPIPIPIHRGKETKPPTLRLLSEDEAEEIAPLTSLLPDGYAIPSLALLVDPDPFPMGDHEQKLRERAAHLEKTFTDFGLNIKVVGIHTGPVITQYEVALETGLRLSKVTSLSEDLALNLGVSSIRIVAPLPNRTTVGIEVPNEHRQTVRMKELIQATTAKAASFKLPVFLGKDVEGRPLVYDMATMPHLLIAGRTGTGKSVCLNAIIQSFLLTRKPDECRLILIDPKKVEFSDYARIPHLMHPVVTNDKKAEAILAWAVDKMEERYELLRRSRVRNIAGYNELNHDERLNRIQPESEEERKAVPRGLPYIVLVIDEVGDLLLVMKKEVESHIIRLAQKSRAAGIHLILATQKPTVDVITGLIKSNLPARICFQVASRADSAVVLDEKGAEKLLGMGDMLFLQPGTSTIIRGQGTYVDDREIERVTAELAQYEPNFESELLNLKANESGNGDFLEKMRERDAMYEQAIEIIVREQRGSTSLLQRALGIGYGRASRLIDFMAEDGLVGGYNGSNAREVLVSGEEWESRKRGA